MGLNEAVVTRTGWWNNHRGLYSFMQSFTPTIHYPSEQRKDIGNIVFNGDGIWSFFPDGRWYQYENINDALNGTNNYSDSGKWSESGNILYVRTKNEVWNDLNGKWFPIPKMPKNMMVPKSEYGSDEIEGGSYVVHKGDKGKGVLEIQEYLLKLKYDIGPKGKDGFFGPDTEAAVKKFQQDNNLVVDGKVGKKTWKMLEDLALPIYREESAKDKEIEDKIMKDLEQPSNQN
jgi:hypothetical protein